jgi:hypothetical protein
MNLVNYGRQMSTRISADIVRLAARLRGDGLFLHTYVSASNCRGWAPAPLHAVLVRPGNR